MSVVALTGKDTHIINGRILNNFATGDCVMHEFESDLVTVRKGKNGNTIYAFNYQGQLCKSTYRIVRGSDDDKFMQNLETIWENDPASFSLMTGQSTKNIGDGTGNLIGDTLVLSGGAFKKRPVMKENADGEIEQAETIYELIWGNAPRAIG